MGCLLHLACAILFLEIVFFSVTYCLAEELSVGGFRNHPFLTAFLAVSATLSLPVWCIAIVIAYFTDVFSTEDDDDC